MKTLKTISRNQPIFVFILMILSLVAAKPALSQSGYGQPSDQYPQPSNQYPQPGPGSNSFPGQGQQVTVYDKGLQMPVGTYTVPAGWNIVQDMATDPNTGQPLRQKLDIVGPNGELMRSMGMAQYAPMMGTDFEQTWQKMADNGLQDKLDMTEMSSPKPSARMQQNPMIQQYAQTASSQGFKLECLEAEVLGMGNGQNYQGIVSIMHLTPANMPNMGTIQVSITIGPANQLSQTLAISEQIANSFQPNPQYQQRLQQIQQQAMRNYQNPGYNNPNNQYPQSGYGSQVPQQDPNGYPGQNYNPYQQNQPNYPASQGEYNPNNEYNPYQSQGGGQQRAPYPNNY